MRTTITLADDIYEAAVTLARGSGASLGEIISGLARQGLRPYETVIAADGLPMFVVPQDALLIPGDRAATLLPLSILVAAHHANGLRRPRWRRRLCDRGSCAIGKSEL